MREGLKDCEGIVYSGFDTHIAMLQKIMDDHLIRDFNNEQFNSTMLSFGRYITGKNKITTAVKNGKKAIKSLRDYYDGHLFIDSGGFQIMTGVVKKNQIPNLIDGYCNMINDVNEPNTYYFIEDTIPTDINEISTINEAVDFTALGLKEMHKLPFEKRKNIYFIYHFQSPSVFDGWQKLMHQTHPNEYLESHRWSVGGIVASKSTMFDTDFITYMLPAIDIFQTELEYMKKGNTVYFHVLGVAGLMDILFYTLMTKLFERRGLSVKITFDSTSSIQSIVRGRYIYAYVDEVLYKISLDPKHANNRIGKNSMKRNIDVIKDVLNTMSTKFSTKSIEQIYEDGKINIFAVKTFVTYQALVYAEIFRKSMVWSDEIINDVIENKPSSYMSIRKLSGMIRGHVISPRTIDKCFAINNTLNVLRNIIYDDKVYSMDFIRSKLQKLSAIEKSDSKRQQFRNWGFM